MERNYPALFGPLAALIFVVGLSALPAMDPGYNSIRQTVSEIGEIGSPAQLAFTIWLCVVAFCTAMFAVGLRRALLQARHSAIAAYLVACMAVSTAGVGVFSFPLPLHNVFGLSELLGYQAPLALALTLRKDSRAEAFVAVSWIAAVLLAAAIVLNLSTLARHSTLWALERPFYGLVQRALFITFFGWCAVAGRLLFGARRIPSNEFM